MPVSPRTALERKHAAMRSLDEYAESNRAAEQRLRPNSGETAVGSADFDHLLRAVCAEAYLRALRLGRTPQEAREWAADDGTKLVRGWNESGCQARVAVAGGRPLERWELAGEAEADAVHLRFVGLVK